MRLPKLIPWNNVMTYDRYICVPSVSTVSYIEVTRLVPVRRDTICTTIFFEDGIDFLQTVRRISSKQDYMYVRNTVRNFINSPLAQYHQRSCYIQFGMGTSLYSAVVLLGVTCHVTDAAQCVTIQSQPTVPYFFTAYCKHVLIIKTYTVPDVNVFS